MLTLSNPRHFVTPLYHILAEDFADTDSCAGVKSSTIMSDFYSSDHCPIVLGLKD